VSSGLHYELVHAGGLAIGLGAVGTGNRWTTGRATGFGARCATGLGIIGLGTTALVFGPATGMLRVRRGATGSGAMRIIGSTWWKIIGCTCTTRAIGTTGLTFGSGGCTAGVGRAKAVDASATAVAMPMIGETRINLMQLTFLFSLMARRCASRHRPEMCYPRRAEIWAAGGGCVGRAVSEAAPAPVEGRSCGGRMQGPSLDSRRNA